MLYTQTALLKTLIQAEEKGCCFQKSTLAPCLGASVDTLNTALEVLTSEGFCFNITGETVELQELPLSLHAGLLAAYLEKEGVAVPYLSILDTVDSTNSEAMRLLNQGQAGPVVVAANQQTAGRGRRGREWQSQTESNLYLSIGFKASLSAQKLQLFTLWVGLNICDYLRKETHLPLQIKWPNDLICQHKKVAGMLAEAVVAGEMAEQLVFGLGLNINGKAEDFSESLSSKASSLAQLGGKEWDMNKLSAGCIRVIFEAYTLFQKGDYLPRLDTLWSSYDALKNHLVKVEQLNQVILGIASGINGQGALRIKLENGQYYALSSGDVSLSHFYEAAATV